MKNSLLTWHNSLWTDCAVATGIVASSALLGFYAHQFALNVQVNVFLNGFF